MLELEGMAIRSRGLRTKLRRQIESFWSSRLLLALLILLGVAPRLAQYLYNRSLWTDEAALAVAIITTPVLELRGPLIYNQAAPLGFLLVQKALVELAGVSEYALRLIPLLAGLASLPVFVKVASRVVDRRTTPVALCLFGCSAVLIYFSSEHKQYGVDVFIALALLWLGFEAAESELTHRRAAILAVVGGVAIWFSHPSLFVLAGLGSTLAAAALIARRWRRLAWLIAIGAFWVASFTLNYLVTLESLSDNERMYRFWRRFFAPFPPTSWADIEWFGTHLTLWFRESGIAYAGLATMMLVIGIIAMLRRDRLKFFILTTPILALLVASGLKVFPLSSRLILFIFPLLYLLVARGLGDLRLAGSPKSILVNVVLAAVLLAAPVRSAIKGVFEPRLREELRPALSHVVRGWRTGDRLYVYRPARMAFHYYGQLRYRLDYDVKIGLGSKGDGTGYERDLESLDGGGRVWFLFSNVRKTLDNDERFFVRRLDEIGERLDELHVHGAAAYLYDL